MLVPSAMIYLEYLVSGLTLGSIYAMVAVGFTMVYGIIKLWNFAHKSMLTWGAFMSITFIYLGLPFYLALIFSMICVAILGVVVERFAYRPLRAAPRLGVIITAIGVDMFLANLARLIWGAAARPFPHHAIPRFFHTAIIKEPFPIWGLQVFIWVTVIIASVSLYLIVQRTKIGTAMRALSQDQVAAGLMGININRVVSFTFAIGTALGALGGILLALQYGAIHPLMGFFPGIKGFAASVLGGIGHIPGAMVGGLVIGTTEAFGAAFLHPGYRDAIAYAIMIAVIWFRPQGLFGVGLPRYVEEKGLSAMAMAGRGIGLLGKRLGRKVERLNDTLFTFLAAHSKSALVALISLVVILPLIPGVGGYVIYVAALMLLYMVLALGLNIVPGFTGLLDLGYVGFYAIGAYTSALLTIHFDMSYWLIIPLAAINGAMWGIILGWPTLRLIGDYFAIVTFGFSEMVVLFIINETWLTRGGMGIPGVLPPILNLTFLSPPYIQWLLGVAGALLLVVAYLAWRRRDRRYILAFVLLAAACALIATYSFGFLGQLPRLFMFRTARSFYWLILVMVIFTVFFMRRLRSSRVGRAWLAIREDFIAAESSGINLLRLKVLAFALSASFGAIGGSFMARWFMFVGPAMFRFWESFFILCMIVLGGAGNISGVILGVVTLIGLGEALRVVLPIVGIDPEVRFALYGLIMVLMIRFRPGGFIPVGWGRRKSLVEAEKLKPAISTESGSGGE